jgi:hypothetical protein
MDVLDQLKKSGMPTALIADALREKSDKFPEKLAKVNALLQHPESTHRVFLVYGNDSPFKDQFCAALMKIYMVLKNKTGHWVGTTLALDDLMIGAAGVTVIPAVYALSPLAAKQIGASMRDKVPVGRAFILCATNKEEFDKVFGEELMTFLSHLSISIDVSVDRATMMEI